MKRITEVLDKVVINTSQNINLEHTIASVGERIVSHLIDYLLFTVYGILILIINAIVHKPNGKGDLFLNIVLLLPIVLYDLICELTMNGQNVGKKIMKLKVVMVDGTQPSFIAYFIRWAFRIVDNIILLGSGSLLSIIITGKGQRLGDIAAKTMVIRLKTGKIALPVLTNIAKDYVPVFPEAINLSDKDYNIIREIIEFRLEKGLSPYVISLMDKAKFQLENKLHISSSLNSKDFLYALEKDYVYYNQQKNN